MAKGYGGEISPHISGPGQRLSLSGEGLLYWSERDPVNVLTK